MPAISLPSPRRELRCIGATTFKEFRKYFETARSRRFQPVFVEEPGFNETSKSRGLRDK